MESTSEPGTMRQVAGRLGLSVMTVSRALRNAPGVAAATHRRVLAMARRLHYRPDPVLAVLNAYRNGRRKCTDREPIAFITNHPTPNHWKRVGTFVRYFEGARTRAEELGYLVEPFWLGDPMLTARRTSRILRDRGIRGLLVGPLATGQSPLDLEWDWFCAVALGRSLAHPGLTTVSTNHFQAVELAWRETVARGFRRIGAGAERTRRRPDRRHTAGGLSVAAGAVRPGGHPRPAHCGILGQGDGGVGRRSPPGRSLEQRTAAP